MIAIRCVSVPWNRGILEEKEQLLQRVSNEMLPFAEAFYRVCRQPSILEHLDEPFRSDPDIIAEAQRNRGPTIEEVD